MTRIRPEAISSGVRLDVSRLVVLLLGALALSGCRAPGDEIGYIDLVQVEDPRSLPHYFEETATTKHHVDRWIVPGLFADNGHYGCVEIQTGLGIPDGASYLVFRDEVMGGSALGQITLPTSKIISHDIDTMHGPGPQSVIVTYTESDTVWVEIVRCGDRQPYRRALAHGQDRDGDGRWGAGGHILTTADLNGDGFKEVMVAISVDWDMLGRELVCLDWKNDRVLWRYPVTGNLPRHAFKVFTGKEGPLVLLGDDSLNNGHRVGSRSDARSYVGVLDRWGGPLLWEDTGGALSHTWTVPIDVDGDGDAEILTSYTDETCGSDRESQRCGGLRVYELDGTLLDEVSFGPGRLVSAIERFDLDGDGSDEIYISLQDNTLHVYDHRLRLRARLRHTKHMQPLDGRDFLGRGDRQLLLQSPDGMFSLLDEGFGTLAQFTHVGVAMIYPASEPQGGAELVVRGREVSTRLALRESPWFRIFQRNPILAFLAGAVPLGLLLGLAASIIVGFRRRNRLIAAQRDELERNLGEMQAMQAMLIASEKYRQARDIAGGFAHEIRNALMPAQMRVSMLLKGNEPGSGPDSSIRRIGRAIEKSLVFTRRITDYAILEDGETDGVCGLDDVLTSVLEDNADRSREQAVAVDTASAPGLRIRMNATYLHAILNNLVRNSLDALGSRTEGGVIDIRSEAVDDLVRISIADNGCGIPSTEISRVFDPFVTTKPDTGIGIGLSMVRRIVEMRGGRIDLRSEPGQGTTFILELVAAAEGPRRLEARS